MIVLLLLMSMSERVASLSSLDVSSPPSPSSPSRCDDDGLCCSPLLLLSEQDVSHDVVLLFCHSHEVMLFVFVAQVEVDGRCSLLLMSIMLMNGM